MKWLLILITLLLKIKENLAQQKKNSKKIDKFRMEIYFIV